MDSREDEQIRGITMKSSAISLMYNHCKYSTSKKILFNSYLTGFSYFPLKIVFRKLLNLVR